VDFQLDQRFDADPLAVATALIDPTLLERMADLPKVGGAQVLSTARTGDVVRQEVRYRFEAQVSGAVRKFVDPSQLTWVEVAEHDLAKGESRFLIRPDHYADLLEGRYAARVVATLDYEREGDDRLRLSGDFAGARLDARLERMRPGDTLLMNRGFHWVNETPFNR
jgi:hypothetical protein